ncbi:MAG TPA: GDP-fucose synthetase [Gammaproteobacteria bacterium]|nr:GDP-fucose synthetase [Gammaproteobacteria bacterium]
MTDSFNNNKNAKVYLAGHRGLVGGAIHRALNNAGFDNLLLRTSAEVDLRNQAAVEALYAEEKPDYVIVAAAKVGGILANDTYPADFIYENLMMEANLIHGAYKAGVKKLLFLGSSCIYPKLAPQPMKEEYLLTGSLEPTNEWYAVAKIAGIKLCQAYRRQYDCDFISAMPTNLYGPGDNFNLENSHVMPALIRKFHEAKETNQDHVEVWGTGTPRREFLYVDDLANAVMHLMSNYSGEETVNVGTGEDLTIGELANKVKAVVGFEGELTFDSSKPDGTPRKLLDVQRLKATGWHPDMSLDDGIRHSYQWFMDNYDSFRR